eukprot:5422913-Alexandrium_andersonii.AAC.1
MCIRDRIVAQLSDVSDSGEPQAQPQLSSSRNSSLNSSPLAGWLRPQLVAENDPDQLIAIALAVSMCGRTAPF